MLYAKERPVTGKMDAVSPKLIVRPDRIDERLAEGEDYRGEIFIGTEDEVLLTGAVISDSARLLADREDFEGTDCALPFRIVTRGLKAGENFEGSLTIVSNCGEVQVPVLLTIEEKKPQVSDRTIRYLDEFVELAAKDYTRAFHIFSDPDFSSLLTGDDAAYLMLCRGLTRNPVTYQRMEEFLIASGRKKPVSLALSAPGAEFDKITVPRQEVIELTRSTWGYLHYEVRTEGSFLEVSKKHLTNEDFVGSRCRLEYIIHADQLSRGRHYGNISLVAARETLTFRVTVLKDTDGTLSMRHVERKNILRLMKMTREYALGKMKDETWKSRMQTLLSAIREMGTYPTAYLLAEAAVSWKTGDIPGCTRLLRTLQGHDFKEESPEVKAAFLALCDACHLFQSGSINVTERLRDWQRRCRESFPILYLLMNADEDLNRMPIKKLPYMEDIFETGCRSPFLFLTALDILNADASTLVRLTPFLKETLLYGLRFGRISRETAVRAALLSANEKSFDPAVYRILLGIWKLYPLKEILEALCRHIMKGDPGRSDYFPVYAEAVEAELRLTRLYEYYIETIPDTYRDPLPLSVRKYFSISSTVSDSRLAFIYANIIRNRQSDEDSYDAYRDIMIPFAAKALMNGLIDENYAVLYQEFYRQITDKDVAMALCRVMYREKIVCTDPRVRDVVICHKDLQKEEIVPLYEGRAYVSIYTAKAGIFFQDEKGRRFACDIPYSRQKLMETEALTDDCLTLDVDHPGFLLHACKRDAKTRGITLINISAFKNAAGSDEFTETYRKKLRLHILAFLTANAGNDTLDKYLVGLDHIQFAEADRVLLIELLILRSFYHEAYDMVLRCGAEHLTVSLLVRLVSSRIEETDGEDRALLDLALYVYRRKKYDERIILYLVRYFDGSLKDMLEIRKSAEAFGVDTFEFDERILLRAVFTGSRIGWDPLLSAYKRRDGSRRIINACLTFASSCFLFRGDAMSHAEITMLEESYDRGEMLDTACLLALLKVCSRRKKPDEKELGRAEKLLPEMQKAGIRLSFFAELPSTVLNGSGMRDSVAIETKAAPGDRVVLHYTLNGGNSGKKTEQSEPMRNVFRGLCVKELVLFYGESLTWYTETEHRGKITKSSEKTLTLSRPDLTGTSRYQQINQMLSAFRLGKNQLFEEKKLQYRKDEHLADVLFALDENDHSAEVSKDE